MYNLPCCNAGFDVKHKISEKLFTMSSTLIDFTLVLAILTN